MLAASYYFYMCWKMEYILLILAATLVNYLCGLQMGRTSDRSKRKKYLVLSLVTSLGLLFAFKYFNFFNESARHVFSRFSIIYHIPMLKILLPVGISFYTFQALSYTIDVYRGHKEPERHVGIFALYVAFFPQLVAGPIERSTNLIPQFRRHNKFDYQNLREGLTLILWGMFKKVVIADRLALYVDRVYNNAPDYQGAPLIIATYFFAFQIYCDFSGYSDIARGTARTMGYNLMNNFDRPYFAKSIPEFWRRWHISLSTWFRDYLYIPLGGNRCSRARWHLNILVVFIISGLWHGANWTFVIWGGFHGIWQVASISTEKIRASITRSFKIGDSSLKIVRIFITFHLVCFGWVFFRANSLSDAVHIIRNIPINILNTSRLVKPLGEFWFMIALLSIAVLLFAQVLQRSKPGMQFLNVKPIALRWSCYYLIIFAIVLLGVMEENQFIYFQF
ncbi:MBOAT family O-acyltransferase [Candidatus Poribacteria bacterium]